MGKVKNLALSTFVAAVAGYVAGLLTAPKSGRETRDDIKLTAKKNIIDAENEVKKIHDDITSLVTESKKRKSDLSDKASNELNGLIEMAKDSKEKAHTLLTAAHNGDVKDKDLNKAIAEAHKAIKHVRTYLRK